MEDMGSATLALLAAVPTTGNLIQYATEKVMLADERYQGDASSITPGRCSDGFDLR